MNKKKLIIINAILAAVLVACTVFYLFTGSRKETQKSTAVQIDVSQQKESQVERAIAVRGTSIKEIYLCSSVNEDGSPLVKVNAYYPNSPVILLTVRLSDLNREVMINTNWRCFEEATPLDIDYNLPARQDGYYVFALSKPTNGWPIGQYAVNISEGNTFVIGRLFEVKEPS